MSSADHVFGGRYRIVGEVGRGGMGVIYRGVDSVLDREVAIKVMSADFSETTDDSRARFFREAKAAARLQHRNIVTVFEFAEQDGVPYIVMEFLKGRSLAARLAGSPSMSLEQKLDVMTELCNGLQFAHEHGVVHRDVKPANVWLLDDGAVKLVDFGIAKISSSMMTLHGDVMGSASYMAPEQIEGASVTGQSDVFSAAVMLYEMIARRRPFEGDSPTATLMQIVHQSPPPIESIVPDLPKELVDAIAKGLAKNPDDRYKTAADFGADLQLIRMSLPHDETTFIQDPRSDVTFDALPLRPEPLGGQAPATGADARGLPGSRIVWIVGAAAALTIVVGLTWWLSRSPDSGTPPPPPAQTVKDNPPPAPIRTIRVDSKPQGAAIALNGADTGKVTPADIDIAAAGTLRLAKNGFEPRDVTLTDTDLQRDSLSYDLRPTAAARIQVEISAGYPFEVYDGTRRVKESDTNHTLQAQEGQVLTLKSAEHFLEHSFKVDARGGRVMRKAAPELGEIYLTGNEQCLVILDGRRLDYVRSPIPPIAAGDHMFRFECRDGSTPQAMQIRIVPGSNGTRQVR